jgi:hypothetical protein
VLSGHDKQLPPCVWEEAVRLAYQLTHTCMQLMVLGFCAFTPCTAVFIFVGMRGSLEDLVSEPSESLSSKDILRCCYWEWISVLSSTTQQFTFPGGRRLLLSSGMEGLGLGCRPA